MTAIVNTTFDYVSIPDPLLADQLRNRADEIRALVRGVEANYIEIGQQLSATKDQLPHGQFTAWVEQSCGFSHRTATRLMAVAREFGQSGHGVHFGVSILEQLAAAPDPQAALAEAAAIADAGTPVTRDLALGIRADAQAAATTGDDTEQPEPSAEDTPPAPAEDSLDRILTPDANPTGRILATFDQGSAIKSTAVLHRLTGLCDLDLAHALNDLVERGELVRVGDSGKLFKRAEAAHQPANDTELALSQLCATIQRWLAAQDGPRNILQVGEALPKTTRIADVTAALEHMTELSWIEVIQPPTGSKLYRAITLDDYTYTLGRPKSTYIPDAIDVVRAQLVTFRERHPLHRFVLVDWLVTHTKLSRPAVLAACDRLVELGELLRPTFDQGNRFDLPPAPLAPAVQDSSPAEHEPVESPSGQLVQVAEVQRTASPDTAPGEAVNDTRPTTEGYLLPTEIAEVRSLLHPGNNDLRTLFKKVSFDEHRLTAVLKHLEMRGDVKLTNGTVTYAPRIMQAAEPPDDVKCFRYASQVQTPFLLGLFDILKTVRDERVRAVQSVESWYALGGETLSQTRNQIAQVQRELDALHEHLAHLDARLADIQPRAVDVAATATAEVRS